MKICIICPVRKGVPKKVENYVAKLEARGDLVYYPPRDNPQEDTTGYYICFTMSEAIRKADEVHIWYSPDSQGVHFDLGIAFVLRKKIRLINNPPDGEGKSYIKVIKTKVVKKDTES